MRIVTFALAAIAISCGGPKAHVEEPHSSHAHHGPVGHRFERADDWTKTFDDPARAAWQKPAHVVSLMDIERGARVADVGAGTGYFLPFLSVAVGPSGKVLALDVEADMIRYVKERAERESLLNVEARVVTGNDPGLEKASLDRILIVDTWHHIPERRSYAAKLADALRPNGMVFVVDFTMESEHGPPREHRLEPEKVVAELAGGGLEAKIIPEQLPNQYMVVGRR
jgi:ubiquinone/menaquinone biosynthesis C-methylase UbiE